MGPIFEQPPLLPGSPGGRFDQRTIIGSEPGEGWQVMGADQNIDAVDLVQREPVDGFQPACGRNSFRARLAEALGGKSDPPCLGERKLFYLRHVAPLTVFRPNSGPTSTASAPARISTQPRAPMAVRRSLSKSAPAIAANTPFEREDQRGLGGGRVRLGEDLDRIGERS